MRFLAALLGAVFICGTASAAEEGLCSSPKQMQGFKTCADIEKAEQEGEVVIYATSPEQVELKVLARFHDMFPKIAPNYLRLQAGAFGSDTVVATTVYVVHSERGVIQSKVGPFVVVPRSPGLVNADRADWKRSPRAVQVVYATATGAVPNDVLQAYAMLIAYWYRQVKTQTATNFQPVSQQRYGDVLLEYRLDKLLTLKPTAPVVAQDDEPDAVAL